MKRMRKYVSMALLLGAISLSLNKANASPSLGTYYGAAKWVVGGLISALTGDTKFSPAYAMGYYRVLDDYKYINGNYNDAWWVSNYILRRDTITGQFFYTMRVDSSEHDTFYTNDPFSLVGPYRLIWDCETSVHDHKWINTFYLHMWVSPGSIVTVGGNPPAAPWDVGLASWVTPHTSGPCSFGNNGLPFHHVEDTQLNATGVKNVRPSRASHLYSWPFQVWVGDQFDHPPL